MWQRQAGEEGRVKADETVRFLNQTKTNKAVLDLLFSRALT